MNVLQQRLAGFATQELIAVVKGLDKVLGLDADLVMNEALTILETRMHEPEFVTLCETL